MLRLALAQPGGAGMWGRLSHAGQDLPDAENLYDYYVTPWGRMVWLDMAKRADGPHGWSPLRHWGLARGRRLVTPTARRWADALKAKADDFHLSLDYCGFQDAGKPFGSLLAHVPDEEYKLGPHKSAARITAGQAAEVVEALAREGFLDDVRNVAAKRMAPPGGPTYTLRLWGPEAVHLYEDLGFSRRTRGRAVALAALLPGRAGELSAQIAARLAAAWPPTKLEPDAETAKTIAAELARLNVRFWGQYMGTLDESCAGGLAALVASGSGKANPKYGVPLWEFAADALAQMDDARAAPFLAARLRTGGDQCNSIRFVAALGRLKVAEAVPCLVRWLRAKESWLVMSDMYGAKASYLLPALESITGERFVPGAAKPRAGYPWYHHMDREEVLPKVEAWWARHRDKWEPRSTQPPP